MIPRRNIYCFAGVNVENKKGGDRGRPPFVRALLLFLLFFVRVEDVG